MEDSVSATFVIYDYPGSHTELSKKIGINPSAVFEKGDPKPNSVKRWELTCPEATDQTITTHLNKLLDLLLPSATAIVAISQSARCTIVVGVYYYQFTAQIHLDSEQLSGLAKLGIDIDVDMYYMSE